MNYLKYTLPILLFASQAHAQSLSELREELQRERLKTEIANERARRQELDDTHRFRDYDRRIQDINVERERYESEFDRKTNHWTNINQGVNVLGQAAQQINFFRQIFGGN